MRFSHSRLCAHDDHFVPQLFICAYINGSFLHPDLSTKCTDRTFEYCIRRTEHRGFLFAIILVRYWSLTSFRETDVPDALTTHDVNCGDTDVSLFGRLCLLRHVRAFFVFVLHRAHRACCSTNVSNSIPRSDRTPQGTKRSSAVNVNVNVHTTYYSEPFLIPQPSRYVSFVDMDVDRHPSLRDQSRGPSFDDDLESGCMVKPPPRIYPMTTRCA